MKDKIRKYIREHELLKKGDHIIIGVSGGADSMCLFHMLKSLESEYEIKLTVAHIHHGMRIEADDDAAFVRNMCLYSKVPYKEHRCNIKQIAREQGCSEEEAGRNERYGFFEKVRNEVCGDTIAVAHTMNDQAETMLMRLIRGSGVTGLGAIMPKRDCIIRPLLSITREEVETYCKSNNILFKEDVTNQMDIYTRNRLRLQVLPLLKNNFNPKIVEALAQTTTQLQLTEEYLDIQTTEAYETMVVKEQEGYSILIDPFISLHEVIKGRIIRKVIENHMGTLKNIHYGNIYDILGLFHKQSGKSIQIDKNTLAIREHRHIRIINPKKEMSYNYNLGIGEQEVVECNKKIQTIILNDDESIQTTNEKRQRDENAYTKNIDYDKINGNLQIRNRRPGDIILLKNGSKKLKDFFIDEKIPKTCRDKVVLIADNNYVIWVVGYRLSEAYYVTEETKSVLQIRITNLRIEDQSGGI